jgi:subtilase family serine protease
MSVSRRLVVLMAVTMVGLTCAATAEATTQSQVVRGLALSTHAAPWAPIASAASLSSSGLTSKAEQIKTLEAAEVAISDDVATNGPGNAWFDYVPLADIRSFNVEPLWNQGIDGAGTTVAVIEGWDDPSIASEVDTWDSYFGLPNPQITTIYPAGALPAQCPAGMQALGDYGSCAAWQGELTLDVESVHLLAPYAKIVISATPADTEIQDDTSSQVAPPEMMKAFEYISDHHVANVISVSDGSNEGDYSHGPAEILAQDPGELTAAAAGIPVVNATGDCGAAQNLSTATGFCNDLSAGPASSTWDDSPFVTAVGGNIPDYTYSGLNGQDSFSVWNQGNWGAENAGVSAIYAMPNYQSGEAATIGTPWRAVPDITMDSLDGTSQAAPEFAGVLALATQLRGGDLGPVNQVLYDELGPKGTAAGIVDITQGNDTDFGVTGFSAGPGYDVATGWGTVDAAAFAPALASSTARQPRAESLGQQAQSELTALEQTGRVTPSTVSASGSLNVTSTGFLPEHPVTVSVDGSYVETVYANGDADLSFSLSLASLRLRPGPNEIQLSGMLLQQSIPFNARP